MPVGAPDDRLFAGIQSFDHTRLTAVRGIKISLLVGTDAGHGLRIWRDHECGAMHAFRRNCRRLSRFQIVHIQTDSFVRLIPVEQYPLLIGKPARPGVSAIFMSYVFWFTVAGRAQPY